MSLRAGFEGGPFETISPNKSYLLKLPFAHFITATEKNNEYIKASIHTLGWPGTLFSYLQLLDA